MGEATNIEWTRDADGRPGATWNWVTGCTPVSRGCDNCYAQTLAERFRGTPGHYYESGFDVVLRDDKALQPLRWRRPRKIFVNSMSDVFHTDIPRTALVESFAVMALARRHTFQVLTKRHGPMRSTLNSARFWDEVRAALPPTVAKAKAAGVVARDMVADPDAYMDSSGVAILPNLWVGVTVEDQAAAALRVGALVDTPAAVRFLSMEPLLGPVVLPPAAWGTHYGGDPREDTSGIDLVVVGGESGAEARPMHPQWARDLRDQCADHSVPYLFKQWGAWAPATTLAVGDNTEHKSSVRTARGGYLDVAGAWRDTNELTGFVLPPGWELMRRGTKHANGRVLDGVVHDG